MHITVTDDFDPEKIARSGQCFRCVYAGGAYRFITQSYVLYLTPLSQNTYEISCPRDEWEKIWYPYFDLSRNYQSIRASFPADSFLKKAASFGTGIRILRQDPWEVLITFILSQRKNIPAIQKNVSALSDRYGKELNTPLEHLHAFPDAAALLEAGNEGLRACGLGYRAPYVLDACKCVLTTPTFLEDLSCLLDEALFYKLQTIRGVGKKVANCVMLYGYGRLSRTPIDVWMSRVIDKEYNGVNPLPSFGEYAGIAQQYLFYYEREAAGRTAKGQ